MSVQTEHEFSKKMPARLLLVYMCKSLPSLILASGPSTFSMFNARQKCMERELGTALFLALSKSVGRWFDKGGL